jgi:hypothetical protein
LIAGLKVSMSLYFLEDKMERGLLLYLKEFKEMNMIFKKERNFYMILGMQK